MKREKELKKELRLQKKTELERIERVLHNLPKINDCDIIHVHRGRGIIFSAWKGRAPFGDRYISIPRNTVLSLCEIGHFFDAYEEDFKWLTERE
jgi:hypothetical protein